MHGPVEQVASVAVIRALIPLGSDQSPSAVLDLDAQDGVRDEGLARSVREQAMEKLQAQLPRGKLASPSISSQKRALTIRADAYYHLGELEACKRDIDAQQALSGGDSARCPDPRATKVGQ